ncbi:DNA methyltransferase [Staphylococcus saprophyticus]|uniref:DNA methyltransferase n=1 Tax=Staphylococcus saprophyticus TaxID=29385 RepID=UPI000E05868C|nr:DNA methyltransferase [Staphylococcus saprophyticus]SUN23021.1 Adenine specific DNA methylase Mod [Staphylococcus saprophyticus]
MRDDGVIFISINDKEVKNLRSILDEIFGERNFIAQLIWNTDGNIDNQSRIKTNHEYILMYSKNESSYEAPKVIAPEIDHSSKLYNDEIANTIVKNVLKTLKVI